MAVGGPAPASWKVVRHRPLGGIGAKVGLGEQEGAGPEGGGGVVSFGGVGALGEGSRPWGIVLLRTDAAPSRPTDGNRWWT